MLGAVGDSDDLARLLELALVDPEPGPTDAMARAFRQAVRSILADDPIGFQRVPRIWRAAPDPLLVPLLVAVGETQDPRALEFISEIISWRDDLLLPAIAQVRKVGPSGDARLDAELAFRLRSYLDPEEPGRCQAACFALAALGDLESIPLLIDLLEHESRGVRADVHWSLRELTGLSFPGDAGRWSHWYRSEMDWIRRAKAKEFRLLLSRDAVEVTRALRTIAQHPLARDDLVAALPALIVHRSPAVRSGICRTAAGLRCTDAVSDLIEALDDPTVEVSAAAWDALRALTRLDLPHDARVWREELAARP